MRLQEDSNSHMPIPITLSDLMPVLPKLATPPTGLRAITYLRTYPSFLALCPAAPVSAGIIHQLAGIAYSWMPRVLRLDGSFETAALAAMNKALVAAAGAPASTALTPKEFSDIANWIRSSVGASKLLHFAKPDTFPIWDSKVERFRHGGAPPYNYMINPHNYIKYLQEVDEVLGGSSFSMSFLSPYNAGLHKRLTALGMSSPYVVTGPRAIEAAAFELAP
ncbi:MAG: hypothetical protein ACRETP_08795 [Steroidobacteraceae bacterium]